MISTSRAASACAGSLVGTPDLALPGNDFWVFDHERVRFGYFAGDGTYLGDEMIDDPAVVKLCVTAFEAVWERAIDHKDYRPT